MKLKNPALFHQCLTDFGFEPLSVDEDRNVTLKDPAKQDYGLLKQLIAEYKEPTREELAERILARRGELLDQLLLERFMPQEPPRA